jgi:branched-chain amino acid transport system ATP-binding protein
MTGKLATGTQEILLSVRSLTKRYGAMVAVDNLDFDVVRGEVLGIGGPNGAGKTTLFDLISGLTSASDGKITFAGHDITTMRAEAICHLGIARTFQLNAVFDSMTVQENLLCAAYFGSRNRMLPSLQFDRGAYDSATEVMEITGLSDFRRQKAGALPVLQRKLLMLAGAIAGRPQLLLLDEPVGGLNASEIDQCVTVIGNLRHFHGVSIIMIEHVMSFITVLADRIMILHQGAKLYDGVPNGLSKDAKVVEVYLGLSAGGALLDGGLHERIA